MADITVHRSADETPGRRFSARLRAVATRRRVLIGTGVLVAAVLAIYGETSFALAASAFQEVSDAYLIQWIEKAGMALGCF